MHPGGTFLMPAVAQADVKPVAGVEDVPPCAPYSGGLYLLESEAMSAPSRRIANVMALFFGITAAVTAALLFAAGH
jgi:hypothetical protein